MQTKTQIRELLDSAGLRPNKQFGQCFLVDLNLMGKLLELAELSGGETVVEVGPGTGSLTEELLERAGRVVAVEIDGSLSALLRQRFAGRDKFTLIEGDALAGKHRLSPALLAAAGPKARLVSNLPYHAATPILAECLLNSWRAMSRGDGILSPLRGSSDSSIGSGGLRPRLNPDHPSGAGREYLPEHLDAATTPKDSHAGAGREDLPQDLGAPMTTEGSAGAGRENLRKQPGADAEPTNPNPPPSVLFESMTFTVQREVADRFAAAPGGEAYGPLSILTALLGRVRMGPIVPATAFWPAPTVASRILRIDFDPAAAGRVKDAAVLTTVVNLAFGQRRKQMRAMLRRSDVPFAPEALERAMAEAGIDPQERAERIRPEQYLAMATALS